MRHLSTARLYVNDSQIRSPARSQLIVTWVIKSHGPLTNCSSIGIEMRDLLTRTRSLKSDPVPPPPRRRLFFPLPNLLPTSRLSSTTAHLVRKSHLVMKNAWLNPGDYRNQTYEWMDGCLHWSSAVVLFILKFYPQLLCPTAHCYSA